MKLEKGSKIFSLQEFLTNPDSEESKNYISDLLSGETNRPEELFVQKFLNVEFWKELGFDDNELKFERSAGITGRVEWTLKIEDKLIAIECKRPYFVNKNKEVKNELDGNDIDELKDQIGPYLLSHPFIIFTNGFHWYFYSRESYRIWLNNKDKKNNKLTPFFKHITSEEIFDKNSQNYILNILQRQNILEALKSEESKSIRHILTNDFFFDLKNWVHYIDAALKDTPSDERARTISLINKLIFLRTMEAVGVIPNSFLTKNWESKKGMRKSIVGFIDQIDDDFSEIYDTELFTSKYIEDRNGDEVIQDGQPIFNPARKKNYAYKALSEEFFSALFKQTDEINLKDTGITKLVLKEKTYYIRSLYWWKFESISGDILGKAYETYLAQERKKLGIYYTPHQITEYLTSKTVGRIFDKKITELKKELEKGNWDIEKIKTIGKNISKIKICDPSCGSGSFLIQAIRIIWDRYRKLEKLIRENDDKFTKGQATLDPHFTDNVSVLQFLRIVFRIDDRQQRMGTLILRHIFGNDKDEKAVDTAKLNVWLECLRLDPNSYRKESLKGKRHVLPNLELNLTVGDSLIGLDVELTDKALEGEPRQTIESIFNLRKLYVESFDKTSMAHDAAILRDSLIEYFLKDAFKNKIGEKLFENLSRILKPTYWTLQHWDAFYDEKGNLKEKDQQGFDVIIGNPPWEILEPNINEFYGPHYNSEEMAKFSSLNKQLKNKIIKELSSSQKINTLWEQYNKEFDIQQDFFKTTDLYKHQIPKVETKRNKIKTNLYQLFVEKYYQLLKKDGLAGVVLPSGIYTDLGSNGLRNLLYDETEIISLYSFENRNKIFEEIHRQFKFITLVFKKGGKTSTFKSAFYLQDVNDLATLDANAMNYEIEIIRSLSRIALSVIECKNKQEVDIFKKMAKFPTLVDSEWNLDFQREFNMTDDAPLFNIEDKGAIIFEGKMIHQFTHLFEKPRYWIELGKGKGAIISRETTKAKKMIKKGENLPGIRIPSDYYRLGWRLISNATNQRTLICTILPQNVFLGNSINYIRPTFFDGKKFEKYLSTKELLYLCGMLNSFVIDFLMRHKVAININIFYMKEIPVPRLLVEDPLLEEISKRVGQLICISPEYDELKNELKIKNGVTDEEQRAQLMAEINAYAAKICNITKEEFEYILKTFPIVDEKIKQQTYSEFEKII